MIRLAFDRTLIHSSVRRPGRLDDHGRDDAVRCCVFDRYNLKKLCFVLMDRPCPP